MKKYRILVFTFFVLIISSTPCFSSVDISPGVKLGINFTKSYYSQESIGIHDGDYPKYAYPIGSIAGVFFETEFTKHLSLLNEIFFLEKITKITTSHVPEILIRDEVKWKYLRLSCVLKFKIPVILKPYLLLGLDIGQLLKAENKTFEPVGNYLTDTLDITDELSSIDISMDLGIGKIFKLSKVNFILEIRGLIGFTKYDRLGIRRNCDLQTILGIQFI